MIGHGAGRKRERTSGTARDDALLVAVRNSPGFALAVTPTLLVLRKASRRAINDCRLRVYWLERYGDDV